MPILISNIISPKIAIEHPRRTGLQEGKVRHDGIVGERLDDNRGAPRQSRKKSSGSGKGRLVDPSVFHLALGGRWQKTPR